MEKWEKWEKWEKLEKWENIKIDYHRFTSNSHRFYCGVKLPMENWLGDVSLCGDLRRPAQATATATSS